MSRTLLLVLISALAVAASWGCARRSAVFEIPDGYVGWVTVDYDEESCEAGSATFWNSVIPVRPDGSACSRTWQGREDLAFVRYFYVDSAGRRIRELKSTGWDEGGEIWGGAGDHDDNEAHFFVGTEAEFEATKTGPG